MYFILVVLTENLLSVFILNDNEKIERILRRLLAIYSRYIKRIKLKYFFQYYRNIILSKYIKKQEFNKAIKAKKIKYISKNNKLRNINNNRFRTINIPSQYSHIMNCSEPIILKPSNNNIAFLMTPCYIVENEDSNDRNIVDNICKFPNNMINNNYLTSRHKDKTSNEEQKSNDMEEIFEDIFYNSNHNNNKANKYKKKYNNIKKLSFPFNKSGIFNSNFDNTSIRNKGIKRKKINRIISTDRIKSNKNRYNYLFDNNILNDENFNTNNKTNNLCLCEYDYINKSKKKEKNKNKPCNLGEKNLVLFNKDNCKKNINKTNREIFSYLYNNNYLNNLRKIDNENIKKNEKFNVRRNIFGIDTEKKQNKTYRIFERKDKNNTNNDTNDSSNYNFHHSVNNNKKSPYYKIIKNKILTSKNLPLKGENKNSNDIIRKEMKKNNKASSLNNYSINSNSQSNNPNLNHASTNCSIGHFNKDNKKLIKKKTKESSKNKYNQNELKNKDEFLNENNSNRTSLQSLSDSKILELASHYLQDDSTSENHQMNNIIFNKKKQIFKKAN